MMSRRELIGTGAAFAIAASAVGRASPGRRFPTVPAVESLALTIVVDNATFGPFLPDQQLAGLRVERFRERSTVMSRQPPTAEFGLSILGRSMLGSEHRSVLVDLGYSAAVLANNLEVLGLRPADIDSAVLSHGHLDHYGGYSGLFGTGARKPGGLPLYVGGEEAFCERVVTVSRPPPLMGALDRGDLVRAGFDPRIASEPVLVAGHAVTTGIIALEGKERAAIPTAMRPGVGCDRAGLSPAKRGLAEVDDDGEHELATFYSVRGLGLVVIASCSHRGVINSIRRAQAISGIEKVHAVVGGFHLVRPRTADEALQTVAELARIDPNYIVPMHCTGDLFVEEVARTLPGKLIKPYVGTKLVFSDS